MPFDKLFVAAGGHCGELVTAFLAFLVGVPELFAI